MTAPSTISQADHMQCVLRLADTPLILSQRMSELVGRAPMLEEEMALANCALDLLGQATMLLGHAASLAEGSVTTPDTLAFHRDAREYRNLLICELPNGDFAHTMLRLAIVSNISSYRWEQLAHSNDAQLASIGQRSRTENGYHRRHAENWIERLAGGTDESHARTQAALEVLWPYAGEAWIFDELDERADAAGILPIDRGAATTIRDEFAERLVGWGLNIPAVEYDQRGGQDGLHTEALGHLLAEMQWLPRSMPEATW